MANGRVCTGFSKPYVAKYSESAGTVTYSDIMALARGVSVSLSVDSADDNDFYADNVKAETASGKFGGGTVDLTVDGLKIAAAKLIEGTPAQTTITVDGNTINVTDYGEAQTVPYVGLGFIARYMENGVTTYQPVVLTKVMFNARGLSAATQEEEIEWQTEDLSAAIFRDDTAAANWKRVPDAQSTEAAAELIIKTMLGYVAPDPAPEGP